MTLLLVLICCLVQAQSEYSYSTDRRFFDPSDLLGYNFVPMQLEVPNEYEEHLGPDEYSFGITMNNLYVKGGEIEGVYNVNNINSTEYGFILTLINPRNPAQSGHLKVIRNKKGHAEALVFRRSRKEPEMILHLAKMPNDLAKEEQDFFTDNGELEIVSIDSIWGVSIFPFHKIYVNDVIQQRLQPRDSTSLHFYLKTELIEKKKKKKKSKKKKNEVIEDSVDESEIINTDSLLLEKELEAMIEESEMEEAESADSTMISKPELSEEESDFKELHTYFLEYKTRLIYQDGSEEVKVQTFEIKRKKERVNEEAREGEEKYQLAFITEKGDEIYVYLLSDRTVSSIELGDELLFMRGY